MTDNNQFIIPLKKNSARGLDTISMLVLALSYCSFLYKAVKQYLLAEIVVFVILFVASGIWYFNIRSGKWPAKYNYLIFIVAGAAWFYQTGAGFAIGALVIMAGLLLTQVKKAPVLLADNEGVAIKDVFTKRYRWAELNNVLIKDSLLTVDCKDNHLFQKEVCADVADGLEAKFNEFCRLEIAYGR